MMLIVHPMKMMLVMMLEFGMSELEKEETGSIEGAGIMAGNS